MTDIDEPVDCCTGIGAANRGGGRYCVDDVAQRAEANEEDPVQFANS